MASSIDVTKPASGAATTQSVRDNFVSAKSEIEALQTDPDFENSGTITNTDTGAAEGPVLDLFRNSASPAASDLIGAIDFSGEDSADAKTIFAKILAQIIDPTNASEDGTLTLQTMQGGTLTTVMLLDQNGDVAIGAGNLSVTGNITVTGTVDGRDLATDGTKLDGIEAGADVTDTANVTAAGALMDSELTSLSGVKTLTVPDNTTISTFGASLVDDTTAAAARTTLGVDAAGTDNSTDVTLAGTGTYLSLAGQQITVDPLDASDVESGTFANARISEASVTQHEAAINAGSVDGFDVVETSQAAYDALSPPDANTIYLITS